MRGPLCAKAREAVGQRRRAARAARAGVLRDLVEHRLVLRVHLELRAARPGPSGSTAPARRCGRAARWGAGPRRGRRGRVAARPCDSACQACGWATWPAPSSGRCAVDALPACPARTRGARVRRGSARRRAWARWAPGRALIGAVCRGSRDRNRWGCARDRRNDPHRAHRRSRPPALRAATRRRRPPRAAHAARRAGSRRAARRRRRPAASAAAPRTSLPACSAACALKSGSSAMPRPAMRRIAQRLAVVGGERARDRHGDARRAPALRRAARARSARPACPARAGSAGSRARPGRAASSGVPRRRR